MKSKTFTVPVQIKITYNENISEENAQKLAKEVANVSFAWEYERKDEVADCASENIYGDDVEDNISCGWRWDDWGMNGYMCHEKDETAYFILTDPKLTPQMVAEMLNGMTAEEKDEVLRLSGIYFEK